MDQENYGQSLDGMRSNDADKPVAGVDDFAVPPNPTHVDDDQVPEKPVAQPESPVATPTIPKKDGKMLKFCLFVFIVLFVAAAAGLGYYYIKDSKTKTDLNNEKSTASTLQHQLSAAKQSNTTQSASLQKTIDAQKTYITTLTNTAQQLKTACSKTCSTITIPAAPAAD